MKLLANHSYLDTCFTQNIDTLERQANVPGEKIVEAHGSFADQHCIDCHAGCDGAKMKAAVEKGDIVRCDKCGGLVKPDIVFFGESVRALYLWLHVVNMRLIMRNGTLHYSYLLCSREWSPDCATQTCCS